MNNSNNNISNNNNNNNNNNNDNNSNNSLINYIENVTTKKKVHYFFSIISFFVLIISEFQFYYNSTQFVVSGCKIEFYLPTQDSSFNYSDASSVSPVYISDSNYTMERCIDTNVSTCISNWYSTSDGLPSYSFNIHLIDRYSKNGWLGSMGIIISFLLFIFIVFIYFWLDSINYICRSRAQLLMSLNILTLEYRDKRKSQYKYNLLILLLSFAGLYALIKYISLWVIYILVSQIDCNQFSISLQFYKSSSIMLLIISNLFVFLFLFKDPVTRYWKLCREYYNELTLVELLKTNGAEDILESLKTMKQTNKETIEEALKFYVNEKYPDIKDFEKVKRISIFRNWNSSNNDIVEAVQNYQLKNPKEFKPLLTKRELDIFISIESQTRDQENDNLLESLTKKNLNIQ